MQQRNERNLPPQEETNPYTPRPAWQVWAARIGLVVMILFVVCQLVKIAGGGI